LFLAMAMLFASSARGQFGDDQENILDPVPPPRPSEPPPKDVPEYEPVVPESDAPWVLPPDLMAAFQKMTDTYRTYAKQFVCDETARLSEYDASGSAGKERTRRYGYLLLSDPSGRTVREYRQIMTKDGQLKKGEAVDEEPFPPAYAWVYLFSRFHEPYFVFRLLDTRFDGFDYVHEIQFKGSLSFTDGKDIRQWEGRVLFDATTYTPLEIWAEPSGQKTRIDAAYRNWSKSFNILGFRTRPAPLGYLAHIQFRHRRDGLTFPTDLRYDTIRAVSPSQTVRVRASVRTYENYRITRVRPQPSIGDVVEPKPESPNP
jgi:hypothetical protein